MKEDIIFRLEKYRLDNKITETQLAEKLGVSYSSINRWLNGRSKPSIMHEYQIKKLLGEIH